MSSNRIVSETDGGCFGAQTRVVQQTQIQIKEAPRAAGRALRAVGAGIGVRRRDVKTGDVVPPVRGRPTGLPPALIEVAGITEAGELIPSTSVGNNKTWIDQADRVKKTKVATFDISTPVLESIRDGKMVFAIDQQQYMQGYLPVVLLLNYIRYGVMPGANVLTGPGFVTKDNAAKVIAWAKAGYR